MWWALIEEIAQRAEEMAGEKETACYVRGYHVYKDIWAAAIGERTKSELRYISVYKCVRTY